MSKENEITLVIDGKEVVFVRKDTIPCAPIKLTDKRIIVADRGWVFVGDCEDNEDGTVTITNAKNIRKWGTTNGLGQLVNGPLTETKADSYGTVRTTPIAQIAVKQGW